MINYRLTRLTHSIIASYMWLCWVIHTRTHSMIASYSRRSRCTASSSRSAWPRQTAPSASRPHRAPCAAGRQNSPPRGRRAGAGGIALRMRAHSADRNRAVPGGRVARAADGGRRRTQGRAGIGGGPAQIVARNLRRCRIAPQATLRGLLNPRGGRRTATDPRDRGRAGGAGALAVTRGGGGLRGGLAARPGACAAGRGGGAGGVADGPDPRERKWRGRCGV